MTCPLCSQRKARRTCPGVHDEICSVCCGTKRLVEIRCPPDCPYLATARVHPAAATVKRQREELGRFVEAMRDLSDKQSQLFWLVSAFLVEYRPPDLHVTIDDDVVDAAEALAATLETAARGVIYEHRPSTAAAERLLGALKPVLNEAAAGRAGTAFERDAAVVLRRIAATARKDGGDTPRAFLDLLGRVIRRGDAAADAAPPEPEPPRLIVP